MGSAVDDYVLADDVAVTDNTFRLLATELKVLRQGADDGTLMDLVSCSHTRTIHNTYEGKENTAITNFHIVLNIDEGEYLTIIADFRLGADFSFWTYFACHNYSLFTFTYYFIFHRRQELYRD